MPISEAWGSRCEEEVDLALEQGQTVTGLGQPSAWSWETELPKNGPEPRASIYVHISRWGWSCDLSP